MKRLLPVGVIIVVLLLILFVVRRCTQSGASNYQTATVTQGPITQLVTATGTLNPVTNVQVGNQVSGNRSKRSRSARSAACSELLSESAPRKSCRVTHIDPTVDLA